MENIIDQEEVMERVDGDMELLAEMVDLFFESCPELLSDIRNAIKAENSELLERFAHTLKGSVGNFSAPGAFAAAFKLEKMAQEGRIDSAEDAYTVLEGEIERLRPVLFALSKGGL